MHKQFWTVETTTLFVFKKDEDNYKEQIHNELCENFPNWFCITYIY